jgi:uncharacterized surface protein with fasciclin (FAS1) repeats
MPRGKDSSGISEDDNDIFREWTSKYDTDSSMTQSPTAKPTGSPPSNSEMLPTAFPTTARPPTNPPSAIPPSTSTSIPTRVPSISPTPTPSFRPESKRPAIAPSIASQIPSPIPPTDLPTPPIPPITLIPIVVPTDSPTKPPSSVKTVMDIVSETDEFQTFEAVVSTAELADLLGNKNASLTVFAPSNRAFDAIDSSYLESLLTPPYNLQLVSLASFHVLAGAELAASALTNGRVLTMLNREDLTISRNAPGVFPEIQLVTSSVDDGKAPIVNLTETVDLLAANGVLHEIDSVLFPPWYFLNTTDVLLSSPGDFQLLRAIIEAINFEPESSTVTMFGPNDAALSRLPEETRAFLQLPENFDVMRQILEYHVVDGLLPFTELPLGESSVQTMLGESVTVRKANEPVPTLASVAVNGVPIESFSLGRTAILYEISSVLIPPSLVAGLPGFGTT